MKAKRINNVIWTAALALIVLTVISMCAVSGTYAKYTSSASGSSSTTVASWDAEVTGTAITSESITAGLSAYNQSEYSEYGITGSAPDEHGYVMSGYTFTVTTGTATDTTGKLNVNAAVTDSGTGEWPSGVTAALYEISGDPSSVTYTFISENTTGVFDNVKTIEKNTSFTGRYIVCFKADILTTAGTYQVGITASMEQAD